MNKEKINVILGAFLLANIPEIITQEEFDDVKSAIKELQKKAELGETYKKLYGEIKKQKDSVVSEIKRVLDIWENKPNEIATLDLEEILRMLGEIDE